MTTEQDPRRAEKIARAWNVIGLVLLALSTAAFLAVLVDTVGLAATCGFVSSALGFYIGWRWATRDSGPGTAGTPGTGPGTEVDTEHPDPGAFIPGRDTLGPGEFYPPPPSRDSSRDFDRDSSRDSR